MSREFTTIITDASWSPISNEGSWAGACISDFGRETYSAAFNRSIPSSNVAEFLGVANTILRGLQTQRALRTSMGWLIQLDNQHCVNLLNFHFQDANNRSRPKYPPLSDEIQQEGLALIRRLQIRHTPKFILAKHVKGHRHASDREPRHWVQEQMDQAASAKKPWVKR